MAGIIPKSQMTEEDIKQNNIAPLIGFSKGKNMLNKSNFKTILSFVFVIILMLTTGCKKVTIEDIDPRIVAKKTASDSAMLYYMMTYGTDAGCFSEATSIKQDGVNHFQVYGIVTCFNEYKEEYKAKWSLGVSYDPEKAAQLLKTNPVYNYNDPNALYLSINDAFDADDWSTGEWGVPAR